MGLFDSLAITGSGLNVYRSWLEAVSDNVANMNTVKPTNEEAFRERFVVAEANDYGTPAGAHVATFDLGNPSGRVVYEPNNPMADARGEVRYPDMDLSDQMVNMIVAQRGYQANLSVLERAREAYQMALKIGA